MRGSSARCTLRWLTSAFRSSAFATIVLNLKISNGSAPRTPAHLPEDHRAGRRHPDGERDDEEKRREDTTPIVASVRSMARLISPDKHREARGRETDDRDAFQRAHLRPRSDHLEESRDDVDLNVHVRQLAQQLEIVLVAVVREGDDDTVYSERAHDRRETSRVEPSLLRSPSPSCRSVGRSSTKPRSSTPYSGCASSLWATVCPTSPAPTMIARWTYSGLRQASTLATARSITIMTIESAQNTNARGTVVPPPSSQPSASSNRVLR